MFSTFVWFESDCSSKWVTDAKLRRNMEYCFKKSTETPYLENFWVLYWHKGWQTQVTHLAAKHLLAYLQEPCYWAAEQTVKKFTSIGYKLPDYFQIAIAEVDKVLKDFNPERGSSLKTFARAVFPTFIYGILRQRQEVDICSEWVFLRKIGKKLLCEALENNALPSAIINQYHLAWVCFKKLYIPFQHKTLDRNFWEAVADLYNKERLSQLSSLSSVCSPETVEQWLGKCAKIVRDYRYPKIDSLNVPKPGLDSSDLQDDLPANALSESLLAEMIALEDAQDRENQQSQINTVLVTTLLELDLQIQEILCLYYKEGLTQKEIEQKLGISQPTVNRRLAKGKKTLLAALVQWSQDVLNISVTSDLVEDRSAALEEWLKTRYSFPECNPS
ncbi:sigma-70 family RNA polymerase sigma factor [Scytonema sp. PRP1]|uniref:sigma-70 family RNA polymerase sigma factor n=1 Tax=Scytonema sp. PRP1 TaxID=3120513 RepID=UPI00300D6A3E